MAEILLASGSPQRRAILEELGMAYRVCPVAVEEVVCATPEETVLANARRKLLAALPLASAGQGVLAADTVVSCDGRILGKPGTPARAAEFLAKLGGRTSCTWTGHTRNTIRKPPPSAPDFLRRSAAFPWVLSCLNAGTWSRPSCARS